MSAAVSGIGPAIIQGHGAYVTPQSGALTGGGATSGPAVAIYGLSMGPGVTIYIGVNASTPITGISGPGISWPTATGLVS